MQDKMVRFLNSIGIFNVDDFDIDFDMLGKNRFKKDQLDMVIVKNTPWDYYLLRQFQDGLATITYPYSIRFSYINRPTGDDVQSLLKDWYQTIYHIPSNINLEISEYIIHIVYMGEEEEKRLSPILKDFMSFLDFLCYEFSLTSEVKEVQETEEIKISKRAFNKITKEATSIAEEAIKEDDVKEEEVEQKQDIKKIIEEEHLKELENDQNTLLDLMKRNQAQMKKERERARLNKRGNYVPIDLIDTIDSNSGSIDFTGKIFSIEIKEFSQKKKITLGVNDDAMGAIFVVLSQNQNHDELLKNLSRGVNVRIRGVAYVDDYTKQLMVRGHYVDLLPPDEPRKDYSEIKRVELHLHSPMSVQDAVSPISKLCESAKQMGHTALAITDHGVVQAFPDAQKAAKKNGLKMIYGCEFYVIDDELKYVMNPSDRVLNRSTYVVFDLETTGLSSRYNDIIEFGAVKVEKGMVVSSLDILINPGYPLPKKISELTDITDGMLKNKPTLEEVLPKIIEFIGDSILISHNAEFDVGFLQEALKKHGYEKLNNPVIDTLALSRYLFPEARRHNLGALCRNMEVRYDEESAHRADYDASVLNSVWQPMLALLTKDNLKMTHAQLEDLKTPKSLLKHIRPFHVVALVKTKEGLKNLYKLVSLSHCEYYADGPRVPRRELIKHREGLLLGSACFNGEVFNTLRYYNEERLKEVMSFYDYIEVQPKSNYSYLVNIGDIESDSQLETMVKDLVKAADDINKIVVATGDVHYCEPEDKIFRDVYISSKAVGGIPHPLMPYAREHGKFGEFENPDQHLRTTDEMLCDFDFLGEEKAYEIVVKNTNIVADMIDSIVPVPNNKLFTPKIENCEQILTDMCFNKAKELYGDPVPELIRKRLEVELDGIINNGYSVIYYIAHKIVKKAEDDGFLVGSRGSVGSSFVATMASITEVNPLPPHYRCPKCKHLEWTSETHPDIKSGYDLPNKKCPICGTELVHDGQNIPFETFLGFHADKTPDIDLNFPGDYQAIAHEYTKELLGADNVFRAGTIETVAEKTAFGFARGYLERSGLNPDEVSRAKVAFLAAGCVDVKRTTGQHPGGIVVIPDYCEVNDFTPIQYPADEVNASWKTTHFDFHSIDETVLKLDMLGHVDPMALKMMADLTGIDVKTIPMNDPKVLSLFSSNKALGLKRNYLAQQTGAMAIPEFGTNFVRGILNDTLPTTFSELVIISGLSHGTDVWNGNAEQLIHDGICTLPEVIGCRDDIMTYLISKGLPSQVAFQIMEEVRRGKGVRPEYEEIMLANKVPEYYIKSCKLIKYMFPKGHATAYVMMAIRVGYFKVYYPLEFYATYFSVRAKKYDIQTMIKGESAIIEKLDSFKLRSRTKGESLSAIEEEINKTLNIAIEMVQRGYTFSNIDIEKSDATKFVVDHENKCLIPPFTTLDGLGESAAISVVEARKEREFYSIEDLLARTKLNNTNIKDLKELGVLKGLPESDQLSLFDF